MSIVAWARRRTMTKPDLVIGNYLRRWYLLPRNAFFNVYLHDFRGNDEDRALHDHMYVNCSIVLTGGYWEHIKGRRLWRCPMSLIFRLPSTPHRIELEPEYVYTAGGEERFYGLRSAISLFITGPRVREWGFHCPKGWVHWQEFVSPEQNGAGRGCSD